MNTFHKSPIRWVGGGGGGGGSDIIQIFLPTFRFFFIFIQICLSWRVAGLCIFWKDSHSKITSMSMYLENFCNHNRGKSHAALQWFKIIIIIAVMILSNSMKVFAPHDHTFLVHPLQSTQTCITQRRNGDALLVSTFILPVLDVYKRGKELSSSFQRKCISNTLSSQCSLIHGR